jgi:hypothetical protein
MGNEYADASNNFSIVSIWVREERTEKSFGRVVIERRMSLGIALGEVNEATSPRVTLPSKILLWRRGIVSPRTMSETGRPKHLSMHMSFERMLAMWYDVREEAASKKLDKRLSAMAFVLERGGTKTFLSRWRQGQGEGKEGHT